MFLLLMVDLSICKIVKGIDLEIDRIVVISLRELCVHPKHNGLIKLNIFIKRYFSTYTLTFYRRA